MKRVLSILLIFVLLLTSAGVILLAPTFGGYEVYRDLSYGDGEREIMDIYIPDKAYQREKNGCVLFLHGGSWAVGDKSEEDLRCRSLAGRGYIAAAMNYTLYTEENKDSYTVDAVLDQIDLAFGYIKSFAEDMGITVSYGATSGYSAGAHLSMLYSFSRGDTAPLDIKFTANLAGPADINPDIWGDDMAMLIGERLSGKTITRDMLDSKEAEQIFEKISPVSYVNESTPPSIFVYGGKDDLVTVENGESLKKRFDEAGVEYDYIFLPNSTHALIHNPARRLSYIFLVKSYCNKYFAD